jgi:hypothetical protein
MNKKQLILLLAMSFIINGCGIRWAMNDKLHNDYYNYASNFWKSKSTPYLIRHFKIRSKWVNSQSYSWWSGKSEKYHIDYKVIYYILEERLFDEKDVEEAAILKELLEASLHP